VLDAQHQLGMSHVEEVRTDRVLQDRRRQPGEDDGEEPSAVHAQAGVSPTVALGDEHFRLGVRRSAPAWSNSAAE
jgi:hypothetical protein